jgi:selenocysteine lyase/cysteine desulfurase
MSTILDLVTFHPCVLGLLIAKKKLFTNAIPPDSGGGTINYVTRVDLEYIHDIQLREEGGTPDILGAIRTGLVFHLKHTIGYDLIEKREQQLVKQFFNRFQQHSKLFVWVRLTRIVLQFLLFSSSYHRLANICIIISFVHYSMIYSVFKYDRVVLVLVRMFWYVNPRVNIPCR